VVVAQILLTVPLVPVTLGVVGVLLQELVNGEPNSVNVLVLVLHVGNLAHPLNVLKLVVAQILLTVPLVPVTLGVVGVLLLELVNGEPNLVNVLIPVLHVGNLVHPLNVLKLVVAQILLTVPLVPVTLGVVGVELQELVNGEPNLVNVQTLVRVVGNGEIQLSVHKQVQVAPPTAPKVLV